MKRHTTQPEASKDNVVLFPGTVEYYQFELTRLLETEQYGEAIGLLRFLLGLRTNEARAREEWRSLLNWLEMMFPEHAGAGSGASGSRAKEEENGEEEAKEISEAELLKERMRSKSDESGQYAERLIRALHQNESFDKALLSLNQLAYLDHPRIDYEIKDWLSAGRAHPLLQHKALEVLKIRGAAGKVQFEKNGESIVVSIEDTPLGPDQYPSQIREIIARVQEISESDYPALSYFAQETWGEFLAYLYGTAQYDQLLKQDGAYVDVWASALHCLLMEKLFGSCDKETLFELYGITGELEFSWEQAYRVMQQFASAMFWHT